LQSRSNAIAKLQTGNAGIAISCFLVVRIRYSCGHYRFNRQEVLIAAIPPLTAIINAHNMELSDEYYSRHHRIDSRE
jgi:hypothetical protein